MAAGNSNIVEVYNAGKQPKQMAMASSWEKMNKDYKLALETAESIRDAAIENANKAVESAKQEKNNALRSGDKAAIKAANSNIKDAKEQAKTTKVKAKAEYNAATEQAKLTKQKTHDELRSAENAHDEEAVVNSVERGRDLADIQKEQTEKLNNVNRQSISDNQVSDRGEPTGKTIDEMTDEEREAYIKERASMAKETASEYDSSNRKYYDENGNKRQDHENYDENGNRIGSNNDGGKDMSKGNNKKGLGLQFSQSFYDNIGNAIKGQPTGNLADVQSKGAKEQAQNLRNASATNQMEAQRAQQIANQNPYAEAGKIASMQNDAENRQNVKKAGVLGAGAALARKTNTPDVQSQIQRQDQQQSVANQRREEEQANQQGATEVGNISEQKRLESRDYTDFKDKAAALSKGESAQPEQKPEQPEQKPEQPEQKPEQPEQPEQKPEPASMPSGNPQHVINALLGSSKGQDLRSGQEGAADKELYDWAISQGVVPIQAGQHKNEDDVNSWEQEFIANNGEAGQSVMQQLRQGRAGEGNDASRNFNPNEMDQLNSNMTVKDPPSDSRVKDIKKCLCDARMKWIKEDWDRDGRPSREDMIWLVKQQGPFHHNDRDYDPNDYDSWDDEDGSILGAYADNIKNYVYNYKPEATQVDPNIDPNQEHIGPMAQDIEQVNPACIKETPEGVKTVDTGRLAMMNAGAIGDLAREVQDLKARLAKLGV